MGLKTCLPLKKSHLANTFAHSLHNLSFRRCSLIHLSEPWAHRQAAEPWPPSPRTHPLGTETHTQPRGGRWPVTCSSDDHCSQTWVMVPWPRGDCFARLGLPQQLAPSWGSPTPPAPRHCLGEGTGIWPSRKLWPSQDNLSSIWKVIFWCIYLCTTHGNSLHSVYFWSFPYFMMDKLDVSTFPVF